MRQYDEVKLDELEYILALIEEYPEIDPVEIIKHRVDAIEQELEELNR